MKRFLFFPLLLLLVAGCTYDIPVDETRESAESDSGRMVIRAGFETPSTKSRLFLNAAGTVAKVLWTSGDAIRVIESVGSSYFPLDHVFTTDQDGVSLADFTSPSFTPQPSTTHFLGYYPNAEWKGNGTGLGVWIPSNQTAVPGGIAEGLNKAYAYATNLSNGFTFKNIPSLVKFRLSGANVSSLARVEFISNCNIAGDVILRDLDREEPTVEVNSWFNPRREAVGSVINLSGTFETDTDYYIAMLPGVTEGFSMVFWDNVGNYVIKESSKTLTLSRSRIVDFGTVNIGDSFGDPLVTPYMTASVSGLNPVDLVVLPDGFTADQRLYFEELAASGIDFLFDTEPYKTYKDYFNVYFIWKPSAETGASVSDGNGTIVTLHDTAFGSYWGEGNNNYDDMDVIDRDQVFGFVSSHCPEIVHGDKTIDEVPVLIIVNDSRYGGRAHNYTSGRTFCQVPYAFGGVGTISWPFPGKIPDTPDGQTCHTQTSADLADVGTNTGNWRNTLVHEFGGHSFGRLKDEYWGDSYKDAGTIPEHTWPVPFGKNVSGQYGIYPWQSLLDNRSALISRNVLYDRIGVYQGGDVSLFNRWRSEKVSCMIDNRQYFSMWQRILIVQRIMALSGGSFDFNAFLEKDVPTDPVRDGGRSSSGARAVGPVRIMPPLAPPELIDNSLPIK